MNLKVFFCITGLLILTSCFKKEEYPSTPSIEITDFIVLGDSAKIVIDFQDGEGDIGLSESDTIDPFHADSKFHYNLYLVYYEKDDELGWIPGEDANGDSIVFRNRVLPLYDGKPKGIKGTMEYTIEPIYYNAFSNQSDTIKYRVQLIDRALNESSWKESQPHIR